MTAVEPGVDPSSGGTAVIQLKLVPPAAPERLVPRPRLDALLAAMVDRHQVLIVSATPGSGKTTAVVQAGPGFGCPMAWLTLDQTDAAPGRLVVYLEAALQRHLPALPAVATSAVAAGLSHVEAVGLLAEAVGDARLVLVLDDVQELDERPEAWAVLESLIRYAPSGLRFVLLSRRDLPRSARWLARAAIRAIGERELAFTEQEAAVALAATTGSDEIDPERAVAATGGWVTGILFEAWRAEEHIGGIGGEADPLHGYLSAHILGQLDHGDVEFLIRASILDEVTATRAAALGLSSPRARMRTLMAAHLPVSWDSDAQAMRWHPRFREYLVGLLERIDDTELASLRRAHGRLLVAEGHHEEAFEALARAGAVEEAVDAGRRAIFPVIERLDLALARRWLTLLRGLCPNRSNWVAEAELMIAIAEDDFAGAVRIADELERIGQRAAVARSSSRTGALIAWSYFHLARLRDVDTVLDSTEPGPPVDVIRYARWAVAEDQDGAPAPPPPTGGPLDALLVASTYYLGQLPAASRRPESKWAEALSRPYRMAALRALGHTQEALELWHESRRQGSTAVALDAFIGPEILIDADLLDEARQAVEHGRLRAETSGSLGIFGCNRIAAAKLALRLQTDPQHACEILDEAEARGVRALQETANQIDVWYGLALLLQSRDEAALERLRRGVEAMVSGGRQLELPTAAVYLAEAEWRAGNEDAADAAADLARRAADAQGSNHLLLQALCDFPSVASRKMDAQPASDSPWHSIGRALVVQMRARKLRPASVRLQDFGDPRLVIDDAIVRPRLTKSTELLAYLCVCPERRAGRETLLEALFDARADKSSHAYLRQVLRRLREVLPESHLVADDETIGLTDDAPITSDSVYFETRLVEAARLHGEQRLAAILAAIKIPSPGPYLASVDSSWAETRRRELDDLASEARFEGAELAFLLGRLDQARQLADASLAEDALREAAWRLRMRVAEALGDEAGVLKAFQGCRNALADLGVEPSGTTRALLDQLRR
jgi:ATP/maltotriose-dependent transcriptional regulator MalT